LARRTGKGSDRGIVANEPLFLVGLQFLARLHDFLRHFRATASLVHGLNRGRGANNLGHDLRIGADANRVGTRGVGQIITLDRGVGRIGGNERVGLPLGVGGLGRALADRFHERRIIGIEGADLVVEVLADADAGNRLNGI